MTLIVVVLIIIKKIIEINIHRLEYENTKENNTTIVTIKYDVMIDMNGEEQCPYRW